MINPAMMRSSVVFPDPDGPSRLVKDPCVKSVEISVRTGTAP
jgi:hypothetical protein